MRRKMQRTERYMFMRSPGHALDVIAELIHMKASLKEQDAWLKAVIELGYVTIEEPDNE